MRSGSYFVCEGPGSSLKSGGFPLDGSLCRDRQLDPGDSDVPSSSSTSLIFSQSERWARNMRGRSIIISIESLRENPFRLHLKWLSLPLIKFCSEHVGDDYQPAARLNNFKVQLKIFTLPEAAPLFYFNEHYFDSLFLQLWTESEWTRGSKTTSAKFLGALEPRPRAEVEPELPGSVAEVTKLHSFKKEVCTLTCFLLSARCSELTDWALPHSFTSSSAACILGVALLPPFGGSDLLQCPDCQIWT